MVVVPPNSCEMTSHCLNENLVLTSVSLVSKQSPGQAMNLPIGSRNMRIQIIDNNPLAHKYFNNPHLDLSFPMKIDGHVVVKNTKVQNGVLKDVHKWGAGGRNPVAVCFDRPCLPRKHFFERMVGMDSASDGAYKGGRAFTQSDLMEAMNITYEMLKQAGVSTYQAPGYEADDLIKAVVDASKYQYGTDIPIDIITNDQDMLPLVDDQVSVYLRSHKFTLPLSGELKRLRYIHVTKDTFQQYLEEQVPAFKGFVMEYNTVLLYKMLRGDVSDNIPGFKKQFPPRKFNAMINQMVENGVQVDKVFRYGDTATYTLMREVLKDYIDEPELSGAMKLFWGMNLNAGYNAGPGTDPRLSRNPIVVPAPQRFKEHDLQAQASKMGINLPIGRY